ncbi:MAG: SPOR domain-containing protein [Treponema sp.]|nr:SPOR domain-containing protein [Treponema sp.]
MEKKKLLLVAVSVGIVLLILISIPLVLVRQGSSSSRNTISSVRTDPENFVRIDPQDEAENAEEIPDTEPEVLIATHEPAPQRQSETPRVTITVPQPRSVAVPDVRATQPAQRPAATQRPAAQRPAPAAAASPASTTVPAGTTVPVGTTASAGTLPETESLSASTPARTQQTAALQPAANSIRAQTNYWVQTGAFSTKIRAEGVKESLESQGITSIIDNPEINGRTLYRVRVGPYINETEANWWLTLVQSIDGFADSQVRQSQVVVQ